MSLLIKVFREKKGYRKLIGPKRIAIIIFIFLFLWLWKHYNSGSFSPTIIEHYLNDYPLFSVLLFLAIYSMLIVGSIPSLPMNLAAGYYWGGILGGIYSAIAVTIGSWIAFILSRYFVGQPLASEFKNKWVKKLQKEYKNNEWKFIAFIRINPIMPTGALNYILGLTSVSSYIFLWVSFLFFLPPSIIFAFIGEKLNTFISYQVTTSDSLKIVIIFSFTLTLIVVLKLMMKIFQKK